MRAVWIAVWILSVAAAFGAGRVLSGGDRETDVHDVDSFRAGLRERDSLVRAYRLSGFLNGLTPENLPAVLAVLEEHSSGLTPEEVRLLALAWTRFDAPGAFAWARDWPTRWKRVLLEETAYAWGFRDGPAALRAVEQIEDTELQRRLRKGAVEGWLRSDDRAGASAYVAAIDDPVRRRRLTFLLASEAHRDGAEAAIAWAESLPEDAPHDFKQGAFYHASGAVAREDSRRAAAWFEAHRSDWYSEGSLEGIARKWAQHHDPLELFDWLLALPDGEGERATERRDAIAAAFKVWRREEPARAGEWLQAALPGAEFDGAIEQMAKTLEAPAPASAVEWAQRIEDPKLRERSLMRSARAWMRSDPAAARAWLAQSDLPDPQRQSIARAAERGPAQRRAPRVPSAAGAP